MRQATADAPNRLDGAIRDVEFCKLLSNG